MFTNALATAGLWITAFSPASDFTDDFAAGPLAEAPFMEAMIDHEHLVARIAATVEARPVDSGLAELCRRGQRHRLDAVAQWQTGLLDWFERFKRPELTPRGKRVLEGLESQRGRAFENHVLVLLHQHGTAALREARRAQAAAGYRTELRRLSEAVEQRQIVELRQVEAMLASRVN